MNKNLATDPMKSDMQMNALIADLRRVCKKIAPLWPLESFVAVNPYLGMTDHKFEDVAQHLANVGGLRTTMPISFYKEKLKEGKITREDLAQVLSRTPQAQDLSVPLFLKEIEHRSDNDEQPAIATMLDVAGIVSGKDWNRFATTRISNWAASYFDQGQALWSATNKTSGLFSAWKLEAATDLTPEIMGLKGFRKNVQALPDDPLEAVSVSLRVLDVPKEAQDLYFHRLLLRLGGWAAWAAQYDWQRELYGGKDGTVIEFLVVLICWEACIFHCLDSEELQKKWKDAKQATIRVGRGSENEISQELAYKLILQEAFDRAAQRELIDKFKLSTPPANQLSTQPRAQAIFCIDVRSEVYRRNLERVDGQVETLGFAGFFAFPISYVPLGHIKGEAQCPVLLKPGPVIVEQIGDKKENLSARSRRFSAQHVQNLWKTFKSSAVTCFSFVSPMGLFFLPKLFTDSFGVTRPVPHPDNAGINKKLQNKKSISLEVSTEHDVAFGIPMEQRKQMAKNALKAMSLTEKFGRFVLIVGHGSSTVNNPHATGLDCGACGGHTGEANAKVAATVLNDREVRSYLKNEGIVIPYNTVFLACLHNTTTDEITIFNEQDVPIVSREEFGELKKSLVNASSASRVERSARMSMNGNVDTSIRFRSTDWSQVRPEWGLAGCSSFIVASRGRTQGLNLNGRAFLHSYEWNKDSDFSVLELIMTAPMVVTSWISLQYFASTVDNKNSGAGNKVLHNVTSGIGVLEGFCGDLRTGLPWQSVHDGRKYQHEPLRLNVVIEAPIEAMNVIIAKHTAVRNLLDNRWLNLLVMDEDGKISHRYKEDLRWEILPTTEQNLY